MHTPAVDAHAHVHVYTCHLAHQPGRRWPGLALGSPPHPQPRAQALSSPWSQVGKDRPSHRAHGTPLAEHTLGGTQVGGCRGLKDKPLGTLFTSRGPAVSYGTGRGDEESPPAQQAYSWQSLQHKSPLTLTPPAPSQPLESKVHVDLHMG